MDFSIFLTPVLEEQIKIYSTINNSLGSKVNFHDGGEISEEYELAILGVKESRGSQLTSVKESPDFVREQLYKLYPSTSAKIIDIGNIRQGETLQDTLFALVETLQELVKKKIIPIIIGGSQELTLAMYKSYEKLEQIVNLTTIDRKIDFQQINETNNNSYLKDIILSRPNFLFNYSNLGSQSYYLDPENNKMMEKLYFDNTRLGELQHDISIAEPVIRNSTIISFDLNSIRQSEVPGTSFASPNGFFGNEACQLSRYAGMSDKVGMIGFYEMSPEFDILGQTAQLVSQMIWFFIAGFDLRKNETPLTSNKNYTKYKVVLSSSEEELIFIKSKKSERWWMKIPYPPSKKIKFQRHHLVPCSYSDYETALRDEMPNLWLNTYNKINIH
ncbi:MAG: formimidoylglutamase [Flavobacteriales bacterium]|jgi:formiminoglutamase|nr:formimidoylglutamase [Flavobacteriales bacterium]MDG1176279.1 formimidoylglutamase [Flavobacteriales bacterium]